MWHQEFFVIWTHGNFKVAPALGRWAVPRKTFLRASRIGEIVQILLIALFGAIGTLARYGVHVLMQAKLGNGFPYGTLLINLSGCFFLGLVGQYTLSRMVISPELRLAVAVGFFGGFTTFSTFGWETAKLLETGEWLRATTYVAASVIFGLLLSIAGIRLASRF